MFCDSILSNFRMHVETICENGIFNDVPNLLGNTF